MTTPVSERTIQHHRLWLFSLTLSGNLPAYPKVSRLCSSTGITTFLKSTYWVRSIPICEPIQAKYKAVAA